MTNTRRRFSPEFKAKVALEALSNTSTLWELAGKYEIHEVMISKWKKELLERWSEIFTDPRKKDEWIKEKEREIEELQKSLGQASVERDRLKKKYRQLGGIWWP